MDRQGSGARTTSIVCIHRIKWDNTSYCSRAGITICHIQDHLLKKIPSRISENHAGLTSQSLHATVGPLQDNQPLFHYVIGISGILPYNRNVTLQTFLSITRDFFRLHSSFARLYNAAASPAGWLVGSNNQVIFAFWLVVAYDVLEDRRTIDVIISKVFLSAVLKWRKVLRIIDKILRYWEKDKVQKSLAEALNRFEK